MHRPVKNKAGFGIGVLSVVLGAICGGCAAPPPPLPPEALLLSGTWVLTTDNPTDLPTVYLTFDTVGIMTNLTFGLPNTPINIDQTLLSGTNTVTGNQVTIAQGFDGGLFNFAGTLDDNGTLAVGNVTAVLTFTFYELTVENAPATMIKQ
jgi:hypothetical protein